MAEQQGQAGVQVQQGFTAGPWTVVHVDTPYYRSIGGAYFIKGASKGDYIARLTDEHGDRAANARLIAAAPELYTMVENLKRSLYALTDGEWDDADDGDRERHTRDLADACRALLARIDGQEG